MIFEYTKNIKITIHFEAPLLGFNVEKAYKPRLEEAIKELILNHISEGTSEEVYKKDWLIKFEVNDDNLRSSKLNKR